MEGIFESSNSESRHDSLETLRGALTQALHDISSLKTQLSQRDSREAELKGELQEKERLLNIELSKSLNPHHVCLDFPNVLAQMKSEENSHALESSHDKDDLRETSGSQMYELKDMLQKKECLLIKAVQKGLARNVAYNNVLALLSEKEMELDEWKNKFEALKLSQGDVKAMEELLSLYQVKERGQLDLLQQRNLEIGHLRRENKSLRERLEHSRESCLDQFWQRKEGKSGNLADKELKLCMSGDQRQVSPLKNALALHEVNALREQLQSIKAELKNHYREKERFFNEALVYSQPQNAVHVDDPFVEDKKKLEVKIKAQGFEKKSNGNEQGARQETGDSRVPEPNDLPRENNCRDSNKVFQRSWARNVAYHNILALLSETETELMDWKIKFTLQETQDESKAPEALLNNRQVKRQGHVDLIQNLGHKVEQLRDQGESLEKTLTIGEMQEVQCVDHANQAINSPVLEGDQLQVTMKNAAQETKKKRRHNTRRRKQKYDQDRAKKTNP
ncbi:uncharacterized protein LOC128760341 isoform X2 [Synchiropus splendidus]|uniref:uncharacterized protein LOC128760341 isoform X2 n=1 Tax=Synchiropus splendidus TaxID=270530 RepID=UPI00237D6E61|nr:uncharacterized protein LOC128760341 isoform X2 [Synchiropus splendidus]